MDNGIFIKLKKEFKITSRTLLGVILNSKDDNDYDDWLREHMQSVCRAFSPVEN